MNDDLQSTLAKLAKSGTQKDFAAVVGISQAAASNWAAAGLLAPGATLGEWLLAYCDRLRQQAEQRMGGGLLDLVQERAALARAQRIGYEMRNEQALADHAPTQLLREVLAVTSAGMVGHIDSLPDQIERSVPDLPESARSAVLAIIASARAEWVRSTAELADRSLPEPEHDQDDSLVDDLAGHEQ